MAKSRDSVRRKRPAATQPVEGEPSGRNIYKDDKGRIIVYYPLQKKYWYIHKYDYKRFNRYRARYLIAAAAFALLVTILQEWFNVPFWIPLLIAIGIGLLLEYRYGRYLETMQPVKKFDPANVHRTVDLPTSKDARIKLALKMFLLILLGTLLVVNAYQQHYGQEILIISYVAMIACYGYAIVYGAELAHAIRISKGKGPDRKV